MILVTVATDAVGGALVAGLCADGHSVRAVVDTAERGDALRGYDCELAIVGDGDPDALELALRQVRHLALVGSRDAAMTGTERALLRTAADRGLPAQVVAIGAGADSGLRGPGGAAWTLLTPAPYFQDFLDQAGAIQTAALVTGPPEGMRVAYVDARDVADVARHVLTSDGHEGATYVVTGPEALSGDDVAAEFAKVLGRAVSCAPGPGTLTSVEPTDEVQKATGRAPRSLRDFVTEHAAAFRR